MVLINTFNYQQEQTKHQQLQTIQQQEEENYDNYDVKQDDIKYTIILDLDETLLHSFFIKDLDANKIAVLEKLVEQHSYFPIMEREFHRIKMSSGDVCYTQTRPGLHLFFYQLTQHYNYAIWSAGGDIYVDAMVQLLNQFCPIKPLFVFNYNHCAPTFRSNVYKPLTQISKLYMDIVLQKCKELYPNININNVKKVFNNKKNISHCSKLYPSEIIQTCKELYHDIDVEICNDMCPVIDTDKCILVDNLKHNARDFMDQFVEVPDFYEKPWLIHTLGSMIYSSPDEYLKSECFDEIQDVVKSWSSKLQELKFIDNIFLDFKNNNVINIYSPIKNNNINDNINDNINSIDVNSIHHNTVTEFNCLTPIQFDKFINIW